jgi:hypothetical protein
LVGVQRCPKNVLQNANEGYAKGRRRRAPNIFINAPKKQKARERGRKDEGFRLERRRGREGGRMGGRMGGYKTGTRQELRDRASIRSLKLTSRLQRKREGGREGGREGRKEGGREDEALGLKGQVEAPTY